MNILRRLFCWFAGHEYYKVSIELFPLGTTRIWRCKSCGKVSKEIEYYYKDEQKRRRKSYM